MASRTPLYERHLAAGGRMVDFAGWLMPQQYTSVKEEQEAVRTSAGLFDVSHMGRFEVGGRQAAESLQHVVTNDVGKLDANRAQYNLMCLEMGGIIDDLVVYRGESSWIVVVNASNRGKDLIWLEQHAGPDVELVDRSEDVGLLALQGPQAESLLPAEDVELTAIPYFGLATGRVASVECTISRTGYTGEDGFELFVPADRLADVWDALLGAGVKPCGLAARDVCRLEAGLRLYGNDMDETVNPYEAGLGWTVRLKKGDFIGRSALEQVKAEGPRRILVGLDCPERTIPRHGAALSREGRNIGTVTSGTYSFWLGKGIAMALVEAAEAEPGRDVEIEGRGGGARARIAALPFYRGSVRQAART
jgi:glycine cleavage system T protein (aminomethyltransferase)